MTLPHTIDQAGQPARDKHSPTAQCTIILKLLKSKGSVTNYELLRMGIPRYSARIYDLRDEGHKIVTVYIGSGRRNVVDIMFHRPARQLYEFRLVELAS
ncbi:helix-turn-helix domain-containing protein [Rhodococcus sp. NPDC004095]